jgi:hypothetical protein
MSNPIVSTQNFAGTGFADHTNPGKKISGPTWAKTMQDNLPWIDGRKLGDVPDEELRPVMHRLGIEGAHRDGRSVLAARYGELIGRIHREAGDRAVLIYLDGARHHD